MRTRTGSAGCPFASKTCSPGPRWAASPASSPRHAGRRRGSEGRLFVEPDVLHPVTVVDAVDHRHEPLDVGLRAGAAARVEDDRARPLFGQDPLDLPHDLLALLR